MCVGKGVGRGMEGERENLKVKCVAYVCVCACYSRLPHYFMCTHLIFNVVFELRTSSDQQINKGTLIGKMECFVTNETM